MARTEERVRELVADNDEMRDAVETVLERADDGEVTWVDVKGDVESGQWGRLIEKGILVDGEEGFELADRDAIEAGLEPVETDSELTESSVDVDDIESASWSKWDKLAGVFTLALFAGYSWAPARNLVGGTVDVALGPLTSILPFYAVILLIAVGTGLYSTLLRALLMDMENMAKYQERMQDIQERRKKAKERGDDAAMQKIQEEQMSAMGDQMGMFKEQFRPMVWIMFLTIPAFLWMYWAIGIGGSSSHYALEGLVIPFRGAVQWTDPVLGPIQVWIVWYFLCSMAFTQIIQKALDIDMSPSPS